MSGALPTWLRLYGPLLGSAVFAAAGQILFKLGAADRASPRDFLNLQIAGGGALYFLSAVLWIAALAKAPLSVAYPFTALTFVLVYLASAFLLGDRPPAGAIAGVVVVLFGLGLIIRSR